MTTILTTVSLLNTGPRLILTYVVQFFLLYKMVKKISKKEFPFRAKSHSQCQALTQNYDKKKVILDDFFNWKTIFSEI